MGRSLYDAYPAAAGVWDFADGKLGFPLTSIAFDGPEDELRATRNTQLALFVAEVAGLRALESVGVNPVSTAGHSIGEYAALVACGALEFEEGLKLVSVRARAMDAAARERPGAMAAVPGLGHNEVRAAVESASARGIVGIANFNSPEQIVISGEADAVAQACEAASAAGAKRVIPLAVSGGFHSPLMQRAADELADALKGAALSAPRIPVAVNVTADVSTTGDEVRDLLAQQVVSQVRWHESVQLLMSMGCDCIIEVGPGKVLSGLARRMDSAPEVFSVDTAEDVESVAQRFQEA